MLIVLVTVSNFDNLSWTLVGLQNYKYENYLCEYAIYFSVTNVIIYAHMISDLSILLIFINYKIKIFKNFTHKYYEFNNILSLAIFIVDWSMTVKYNVERIFGKVFKT